MSRSTAGRIAHHGLVLSALCGALALGACSSRTEAAPASGTAPAASRPAAAAGSPAAPAPSAPAKASAAGEALADGTHTGYLTKVDTAGWTVSFDKVEWLSGKAAAKAYQKDNPGVTDGPPNDYYIVNDNKLVRTLPVTDKATVTVIKTTDTGIKQTPTSFAALPGYLSGGSFGNLFKLTVKGGKVTSLASVYVP